jgi:hypothetical protein
MQKRLRNGGMITDTEYKGKTLEEAKKYAEDGGFEVRIVEENGVAKMLDMSVKSNRVNFRLKNGFVTDVFGG